MIRRRRGAAILLAAALGACGGSTARDRGGPSAGAPGRAGAGGENGDAASDGCNPYCEIESETCGDGVVDEHEQCDDGNTVGGDFCDASCSFEYVQAICGDGVVTSPIEHCDDANSDTGDGCSSDCRLETECGNGVVEGVEECDDGGTVSGDGCSFICREEFCGDGISQPRLNEECDFGDNSGGYGLCAPGCVLDAHCGDGIVQDAYEDCDDGNHEDCDGCSAACHVDDCGLIE